MTPVSLEVAGGIMANALVAESRRTGQIIKLAHDPGDPLITSHCPFCGSGQVVGRSDGTIGCDFCGQVYIVRVQPAFPGMPQAPGGAAPSDVGPDGGLLDPGMIGPDGLPAGGMPPGGDEEDGEGFPPEEDEEGGPGDGGDGGAPPPSGKKDDSKESGPPKGKGDKKPPPKSKGKKEGAYRGLQGQPLDEEQLIRHLAVEASGRDPRVLAALRAEGSRRPFGRQADMSRHDDTPWYAPQISEHWDIDRAAVKHHLDRTDGRLEATRAATARALGGAAQQRRRWGGYGGFRIDSGHHVMVNLDYPSENWYAAVAPPEWPAHKSGSSFFLHLGKDDAQVPEMLSRRLSHPDVRAALGQSGAASDDDPWAPRHHHTEEEW